jgi:hypothetical protein
VRTDAVWAALTRTCGDADIRFAARCENPEQAQTDYLRELLSLNAETAFGLAYGFAKIADYSDYAEAVPISSYEGFAPFIRSLERGDECVLTAEAVTFVEQTGGSTGGSKIVPYTARALEDYAKAMSPWLSRLIRERGLRRGRIYFALSPAARTGEERIGVLRLGSPEAFAYFGNAAPLLAQLSIAPPELAQLTDFEAWSFATCLHFLAARDLALIWVWSPTYLTELIRAIQRMKPLLLDALACGRTGVWEAALADVPIPPADAGRAAALDRLFGERAIDTAAIWPHLDTISCWMDASSAPFAAELQTLFPAVNFQPKGLMLTEGAMTFPFGDAPGAPLALDSGFFEFMSADRVFRAWELVRGATYRVVLSNHSGFYRYDTGDLVEAVGFTGRTPRLVFKGRAGLTSDLCGEKLTEEFVLFCVRAVIGASAFAFLAACKKPHPHYALCVDKTLDAARLCEIADGMETELSRNPQYAYARRLRQLSPLEIRVADNLFARYREWAIAEGRSIGALKAPALLRGIPHALEQHLEAFTNAASAKDG